MKRIAMIVVAIIIAVFVHSQITSLETLLPQNAQWCELYVAGENDSEISGFSSCKTTNMTIYRKKCHSQGIKLPKVADTLGVAVKYESGKVTLEQLVDAIGGKVRSTEKLENSVVYCGYSNRLGKAIVSDGAQINFQIAVTKDGIIFGSPMILGSY
ncbi:MAG: hypothetical protein RR993_01680 [Clostridia bacterium]